MFHPREIVTAIELGTSKFSVLVGEVFPDGRLNVIGQGSAPSAGSVVKGEIDNMDLAFEQLMSALNEAEQSSDRELGNSRLIVVSVTGCGIDFHEGTGTVFVKNSEHKVTEAEQLEAHENARIFRLAPDREIINSSDTYFRIDGRRVRNPLNLAGTRLDAVVHVVHAQSSRLENFRSIIRDAGFEETPIYVAFAPLAADLGILSEEERENGVLLIDLGAGTTNYVVQYGCGVVASGMLPVGFEHVCNDLSIGLDLPIDYCRKLFTDGILERAFAEHQPYIEYNARGSRKRQIPLGSFETIVDLRIRETFDVIRRTLTQRGAMVELGGGGVLTGGGALFCRSSVLFKEIFGVGCRIGRPLEIPGAATDLCTPRHSTVWGTLRIAAYFNTMAGAGDGMSRTIDALDSLLNKARRGFRSLKDSFRI